MIAASVNKLDTASAQTRQALIEAGGAVFAEQGFHDATVRDICARAGANIAAVHYHFGDKEALYCSDYGFHKQLWVGLCKRSPGRRLELRAAEGAFSFRQATAPRRLQGAEEKRAKVSYPN